MNHGEKIAIEIIETTPMGANVIATFLKPPSIQEEINMNIIVVEIRLRKYGVLA